MAKPWPTQALPMHEGHDSGRFDFSVPTWPAEAATAVDQRGGLGGGALQQKPDLTLACMKGHALGPAISQDLADKKAQRMMWYWGWARPTEVMDVGTPSWANRTEVIGFVGRCRGLRKPSFDVCC